MRPEEIRYIIQIAFPLVFGLISMIPYIYLKRWIGVWGLSKEHNKTLLIAYKIVLLYCLVPMFFYYLLKLNEYYTVLPLWLKLSSTYPIYIWILTILPLTILLTAFSLTKLLVRPFVFLYRKYRKSTALRHSAKERAYVANKHDNKNKDNALDNALERRIYIKKLALAIPSALITINTGGIIKNEFSHRITDLNIKDDSLKGLNIVQISDIHFGSFMGLEQFMFFAKKINDINPDFIVITGDIIDVNPDMIPTMEKCFESLNPKGREVYVCLGNHDYYTGEPPISDALKKLNFTLLVNDSINVKYKDWDFNMLGLDYPYRLTGIKPHIEEQPGQYLDTTFSSIKHKDRSKTNILLSHHPTTFSTIKNYNVKLTLSGHTHGGQLLFGRWNNNIITPLQFVYPYLKGHYKTYNDRHLYVNSGLGSWMPLRVNCPVEITNIKFV